MWVFRHIAAGLRGLFRRASVVSEIDEELRDYRDRARREYELAGLTAEEAARAAGAEMGSLMAARDQVQTSFWEANVAAFARDLRHGARLLAHAPGLAVVAVSTLALGTGATMALFSVADEVLFKPLPVTRPAELVLLGWRMGPKRVPVSIPVGASQDPITGDSWSTGFSFDTFQRFRARRAALSDVFAFSQPSQERDADGQSNAAVGQMVSGNYHAALGVSPRLGRLLTKDDDSPDAAPVTVISHRYWQRRFGGSPNALGQTIRLHGLTSSVELTIVGVTPASFIGLQEIGTDVDFSAPLQAFARLGEGGGKGSGARLFIPWVWGLHVMGRMRAGVTQAQVETDLVGAFQDGVREAIASNPRRMPEAPDMPQLTIVEGSHGLTDSRASLRRTLTVFAAIVGTVLVIVCVNLTTLLLARAESRRKEMAVRLAIGAGRGRLIRQLLTESVLVTTLGATFGVLVAYWTKDLYLGWITRVNPSLVIEPQLDGRALAVTFVVATAAGLLVGVVPALRATRAGWQPGRKDTSAAPGARALFARTSLVAQVGMAVVLLVAAGLFVRTLRNLQTADVGFNAANVLIFDVEAPLQKGAPARQSLAAYDALTERLASLPGVRTAAFSDHSLVGGRLAMPSLTVPGRPREAQEDRTVYYQAVSAGFFDTMEMRVVAGRGFVAEDRGRRIAVVNETLAQRFFDAHAIGRRVAITKDPTAPDVPDADQLDIIGVVRDAKYMTLREPALPTVFVPASPSPHVEFAVRTAGSPLALVNAVRAITPRPDDSVRMTNFRTQTDQIARTFARERQIAALASTAGLLALALTSIGLYGLLSYSVSRQTQEFGVRFALGARRRHVIGRVLRETMWLVGVGVVLGLVLGSTLTQLVSSVLFGLAPHDPATLAASAVLITIVGLVSALRPALRAARVDPLTALRYE